MRDDLPGGTVTFLFTDVEGSTTLLHSLGAEAYAEALAQHRRVIREACISEDGVEVDTQGDAFFFAFPRAPGAVAAAAAFTEALDSGPIQVRVGLHTGAPLLTDEGYVGDDVHFAARVAASAHGGQVICSAATAEHIELALTDLGEHRFKDIQEAVSIYQLGDGAFPPLKTISNTNLPRPASSFLGREAELAEVLARISEGARLVTLTGPGGTGKTRIAIEAASTLVPSYKAGVFWIGLATLRDPTLVSETIVQVLGAKDSLSSHISERELLLLLDNLEQVIEAAPELSQLLQSCPNLTLLVTSRELLRVAGEVEYAVPPLPAPEAVALFCERAQLQPSDEIAELCARLDSLPLAVELAAARTKALTPAQILERLSGRLDLLQGGRDADPRQQTLRATIEWSYELLSQEEQQLFARLSVFAGGCTLEAAEEVADADLDTLQSLVEKSLLRFSDERYWMLETIREYAGERRDDSENGPALRSRHAKLYLELAQTASPHLRGAEAAEWFDCLERDLDNLRQALDHFGATDPAQELAFANAIFRLWWVRGHLGEGRKRLEDALARTSGTSSTQRANALHSLEFFASSQGDYESGRRYAERALSMHRELGDEVAAAYVLNTLGRNALARGDRQLAKRRFNECLTVFSEKNEGFGLAMALGNLGELALETEDIGETVALLEQATALAQRIGWDEGRVLSSCALGVAALLDGKIGDAIAQFRESLQLALRLGHVEGTADCLDGLARCASATERQVRAARLLGAASSLRDEVGVAGDSFLARHRQEAEDRVRAELGDDDYARTVDEGRAMSIDGAVEYALSSID